MGGVWVPEGTCSWAALLPRTRLVGLRTCCRPDRLQASSSPSGGADRVPGRGGVACLPVGPGLRLALQGLPEDPLGETRLVTPAGHPPL